MLKKDRGWRVPGFFFFLLFFFQLPLLSPLLVGYTGRRVMLTGNSNVIFSVTRNVRIYLINIRTKKLTMRQDETSRVVIRSCVGCPRQVM